MLCWTVWMSIFDSENVLPTVSYPPLQCKHSEHTWHGTPSKLTFEEFVHKSSYRKALLRVYIYVYSIHYNIIIHYYIWNSYLPNVHRSCLRTSPGVAPAASAVAAATFHGHGDWGCSIAMFDYWRVLTIVTRPPIWFQMEMSRNHTWSEKIRKTSSSVNPTLNNLKNHQILMFRIRFPMENDHPTTNQIVCGVPNIHSQIPTK